MFKRKNNEIENFQVDERLTHIAFIMDGNGRWAKSRGLPRKIGHRQGAIAFEKIVDECLSIGIKIVTVYAFSTENWKRPKDEVDAIMNLLDDYIEKAKTKQNVRYIFLGDKSILNDKLKDKMIELEQITSHNEKILNIAFNYGGRAEIVHAFNELANQGKKEITEDDISANLYTKDSKDPDLIVRTANEQRISNFLLWQCAYSEFYFTKVLWPDFNVAELHRIIKDFYSRKRNYGGI